MSEDITVGGKSINLGGTLEFLDVMQSITETLGDKVGEFPALMALVDNLGESVDAEYAAKLGTEAQTVLSDYTLDEHGAWVMEQLAALAPDAGAEDGNEE